jgi:hypothetical protein
LAIQNFKIKHGLNLGDHELIDSLGNINLPVGAGINIDNQPLDALPDQTNQLGKYLTTNGTDASWSTITQYSPPTDQGGGNFLSGDGTYKTVTVPTLLSQLTNDSGYQTGAQVASSIAALVDTAPSTLDTLNELATALGNDANFSTSVTNLISAKWTQDNTKIAQWDSAYSWGDHSTYGYALSTNVTTALSLKADTTTVNAALSLKADQSSTYTKNEVDSNLALKANQSSTYTKAEVDTSLSSKADITTVNSALALKADQSTTYTKTDVDTSLGLKLNNAGGTMTGQLNMTAHIIPTAGATYDLGSSTVGWRNVYTNDLHLSNEGHDEGNAVDGTRGNWTIQEGSENLYIINNKSGKKYKFALEEIL